MAEYKHGAYGNLSDSVVESMVTVSTVPVYFGTAPVNLVRGYAEADIVNAPVRLTSLSDARARMGDSSDWEAFTLCEAIAAHYNTTAEAVGPIYFVNVLDPDKHRAKKETVEVIGLVNGTASFATDRAILDTITIAAEGADEGAQPYAEGADYTLAYNHNAGKVVITAKEGGAMADGNIAVSFFEVTPEAITSEDIIGYTSDDGQYFGIDALQLLYQEQFVVPNLLAAPGWTDDPEVYSRLVKVAQKINGHWDAFVVADLPLQDGKSAVDTIDKAIAWKDDNAYDSERSAVCWPQVSDYTGRVFHLSTLYVVESLRADNDNDGVPFESCSNKAIPVCRQHFGDGVPNRGFDQVRANGLNERGITTAIGWAGEWVLWGSHTAAYRFGSTTMDARSIFATAIRMLFHITNYFQLEWATTIDEPMTRALQDRIINREQAKLDGYVTQGALLGKPTVVFDQANNPDSSIMEGDFRWDISVTPTPPLKSASVYVAYTDEGFSAYFEDGE